MDDAISVDSNINDIDDIQQKKLFEMEWSEEHENILIDWADKAMCYRWLHAQANSKFASLTRWFTIPVIIISTLTGTANFAQDRVSQEYISLFVMIVGALNLIAGIISTIAQFLKINELNESHRVSSIAWDKFYRNIKIELAKHPNERVPVGQMIKLSKEEFDRMMETSPVIQQDIIAKFNKTFKGKETFIHIKKPEICDELVSTESFRYVAKEIDITKSSQIKNIAQKTMELSKKLKKIKEFIKKFNEVQGRDPTKDEIMDSIQESYPEFKNMSSYLLDSFVSRVLKETENSAIEMTQIDIKNIKSKSSSKQTKNDKV